MGVRSTNVVALAVTFSILAIGAALWGYMYLMQSQGPVASVEIEQMAEPAWGVEVKEMPADNSPSEQRQKGILTAEAADSTETE